VKRSRHKKHLNRICKNKKLNKINLITAGFILFYHAPNFLDKSLELGFKELAGSKIGSPCSKTKKLRPWSVLPTRQGNIAV
jgi:hypothetical protein